jgi:hypothetical protein
MMLENLELFFVILIVFMVYITFCIIIIAISFCIPYIRKRSKFINHLTNEIIGDRKRIVKRRNHLN